MCMTYMDLDMASSKLSLYSATLRPRYLSQNLTVFNDASVTSQLEIEALSCGDITL